MNIIEAIQDRNLFRPFLAGKESLMTWHNWSIALRCLYGLPLKAQHAELIQQCTGRDLESFPASGFQTALFLTGRRSGKSRIAATIGAYEAVLSGREQYLSPGEQGVVAIISPTALQSRIVKNYIEALFTSTPILADMLVHQTRDAFYLKNNVRVEILTGDFRSVRGYSLICAIVDELCFFNSLGTEGRLKDDRELVRSVLPALSTTGGKLVAISSPYGRNGWAYSQFKKHWGRPTDTLVWMTDSRTMNPTLRQSVIDRAMKEDPAAARSEYGGQWRDDVAAFIGVEIIEAVVKPGRGQLLYSPGRVYHAFADLSGGRGDSAALGIGHREDNKVIVDFLHEWKPPFSPAAAIEQMAAPLKEYGCRTVIGDRFAGEFTVSAFRRHGIVYQASDKTKSELYLGALPIICSGACELLDNEKMVTQWGNLQRRTRAGGKDLIDTMKTLHDDLANVVAGVLVYGNRPQRVIGPMWRSTPTVVRAPTERMFPNASGPIRISTH